MNDCPSAVVVGGFVLLFYNTEEGLVCGCWNAKGFKIETSTPRHCGLQKTKDTAVYGQWASFFVYCADREDISIIIAENSTMKIFNSAPTGPPTTRSSRFYPIKHEMSVTLLLDMN